VTALTRLAMQARRRWWMLVASRAVLGAVGTGAVTSFLLAVARWSGVTLAPSLAERPYLAVIAVAGLTMIVVMARAARRAPSLVDAARWLDRHHGLHERLSTALEIDHETSSLIRAAVAEDAARHVPDADVARALPLTWPRWGWVSVVTAAVAIGTVQLEPTPGVATLAPSASIEDRAPLDESLLARSGDTASRVAALLRDDPATRDDPYLRAVTEGFEELGERVRSGELDVQTAQLQLEQLLGHLRRAVEHRDDSIATLVTSFLDSGAAHDDGRRPDQSDAAATDDGDEAEAALPADRSTAPGSSSPNLDQLLADLERALGEAESVASERPPAATASSDDGGDFFYGVDLGDVAERAPSGLRQDGDAAGTPVGAAELSDDSPGDAAGDGFQSDVDQADRVELGLTDPGEDVVVTTDEIDGGRRITVEATPETSAPRRGGASHAAPPPAHRVDEASVSRERLTGAYVQVVSRYFRPDLSEQRSDP